MILRGEMTKTKCWAALLLCLTFLVVSGCDAGRNHTNYADKLMSDIFAGYNVQTRPLFNQSDSIMVYFGIAYSELVNLDEINQVLTSNLWIRQLWKDEWLTWDPSEYAGITSIEISPEHVWKPDIVLYNNVNDENNGEMFKFDTPVIIYNDGTIRWLALTKAFSSCKLDITYFPFDTQICKLTFGSWTRDAHKLDLSFYQGLGKADLAKYTKSGEWEMVSADADRRSIKYNCCPFPFPDLTFKIKMKRLPRFYIVNLIIPCGILALLAALSFLCPPESGERLSLVITILLGMTVFMLIFASSIPPTSEVTPVIGKYFIAVVCEISLSLIFTCGSLKLFHHFPDTEVPMWLKKAMFTYMGCVLCHNCSGTTKSSNSGGTSSFSNCQHRITEEEILENGYIEESDAKVVRNISSMEISIKGMGKITNHLDEHRNYHRRKHEWQQLVRQLDKLFFWLFTLTIFISSMTMFLMPELHSE